MALVQTSDLDAARARARAIVRESSRILKHKDCLESFLDDKFKSVTKCPQCGGILPELMLKHGNREYVFTCTKIIEDEKLVDETDYATFSLYAQTLNPKIAALIRKLKDPEC